MQPANEDEIQSLDGMPPVKAVAFDVIETLFSLDSLRPSLASAGLDGHHLETLFASFMRDAFALEITGEYKSFRNVASANLSFLLEKELGKVDRQAVDHVLDGFTELVPHDDVRQRWIEPPAADKTEREADGCPSRLR